MLFFSVICKSFLLDERITEQMYIWIDWRRCNLQFMQKYKAMGTKPMRKVSEVWIFNAVARKIILDY